MNEFVHDDACMQALSDSSNAFVFFLLSFFLLREVVVEFTRLVLEPR